MTPKIKVKDNQEKCSRAEREVYSREAIITSRQVINYLHAEISALVQVTSNMTIQKSLLNLIYSS